MVGSIVSSIVGAGVGSIVGSNVGAGVGFIVGSTVRFTVETGFADGTNDGADVEILIAVGWMVVSEDG